MRLKDLINPELIVLDADIKDRRQLFESLSELMSSALENVSAETILNGFMEREDLGGTNVGDGIALPHARVAPTGRELLAVIRPKKSIDWGDKSEIDLVVATLTDPDHPEGHLNLLSSLARILHKPKCLEMMRKATNVADVVHVLAREGEPGQRFYELVFMVLPDDEAVHDILNVLSRLGIQGATSVSGRGMAEILSAGPSLFAGFRELFGAIGSARLVLSAIDATMVEPVLNRFREWRTEAGAGGVAFSIPISGAVGLNRDEF
ncbi:MAG: PTS sugar transporter subunit IIA [Acidobacteria bacterium]|nr:PTS sugar transporter subunit IIA [Acidobacteriota bacterium]